MDYGQKTVTVIMMANVIIDNDLILDVDTSTIKTKDSLIQENAIPEFPVEEINKELDYIEDAIDDLYSSLDASTTSRLSADNREGIYHKQGMITNIVMGVIVALLLALLLIIKVM